MTETRIGKPLMEMSDQELLGKLEEWYPREMSERPLRVTPPDSINDRGPDQDTPYIHKDYFRQEVMFPGLVERPR